MERKLQINVVSSRENYFIWLPCLADVKACHPPLIDSGAWVLRLLVHWFTKTGPNLIATTTLRMVFEDHPLNHTQLVATDYPSFLL
jgi:hypothetical protein